MSFKVKPFREVIQFTKEKLDESLAPVRARAAKARAEVAVAKLDEKLLTLERELHEACAVKDMDIDGVLNKMDEYEITERRRDQLQKLVADLFPE